ncbi:MAG: hypothetical protein DDT34_01450 [Firmicutes bacterium]|nr:hypothetical protein [Bacillota bacterium]
MQKTFVRTLSPAVFELDAERLRRGYYTDAYFSNTVRILAKLAALGYSMETVAIGDIEVEMQFFPRRQPFAVVCGVEESLAMLKECAGYYSDTGEFINTYAALEIEAVPDGTLTPYNGDSLDVKPVLKVRGRYRDFALLETPILGILTEGSRVATNVYQTLVAARGKDVYFFPARFAHYKVQPLHGYAYSLAVRAYNLAHEGSARVLVSTDAQGSYIGIGGSGTISHASIACFLGNTTETMLQFCRIMPKTTPRIALIDFHNDCVGEAKKVMSAMFRHYWEHFAEGDLAEAERYVLYGVRPDTAGNMRDVSVAPTGDKEEDNGVNPRLVLNIRQGLDSAWLDWNLAAPAAEVAAQWCQQVKIIVTGGFDIARINKFEARKVPVDIYGVGSSLLENSRGNTTDFTGDIVRVKLAGDWVPLAKLGRKPNQNAELCRVED